MPYLTLALAVLAETIGTTALQASQQFTRPLPAAITVVAYAAAFWLLSLALRSFPVGIAYAIWSGLGIVFIAVIGRLAFGQRLDWPAMLGMTMILAGILVIHLFSRTGPH
ncbi:SMR family transporter [Salipiger mucosus]|uniref:Ethidium bromide-methyl viologen resistance protein EmrE n=1 Tax=Salipiger mucosus DSM 16094 TaxID=1123237 RepID=S9QQD6_9RHOB|nr:SMR family transporter [Salipiger mucosus]EPX81853.1 Ethidium bromide-methyl viologen resistance protein EmrE [Salipiger mucosus DSM 16094]